MSGAALEEEARRATTRRPRVAVVADFAEEYWPSMDLVADMLVQNLHDAHAEAVDVTLIRPRMSRRFDRIPLLPRRSRRNADRLIGRFLDYPLVLARHRHEFDLFHIVDHSYAHLAAGLPAGRTVITCHDLDAFRCLWEPAPGEAVLRRMAARTLDGLRRAGRVICVSRATRDELIERDLVPAERIEVIANGVHPVCSDRPEAEGDRRAAAAIGARAGQNLEILHVGSTIPRKRIDVLLRVFAELHRAYPGAKLLRVGGELTPDQARLAAELGIAGAVVTLPPLDRTTLAAVYRRSALLLLPSEREGFGLPLLEALASGLPVLASDLDVLREVGDDAAEYAPVADVRGWTAAAAALLRERESMPESWSERRQRGLARAAAFTWSENARKTLAVYEEMFA